MQNYQYKVKNTSGNLLSGNLQAASRESAINTLKQKGYFLIQVHKQDRLSGVLNQSSSFTGRINTKDKAIFTHQLASLLKAGMQITLALKTLTTQTENKHLSSIIAQLRDDIEQSSSLSEAMSKHPRVFPKVYTAIINAAEHSGSLAETLAILASQLKSESSIKTRIRGAMIYPIFLLFVSCIVVGILMTFVIPKFIKLFITAEQNLPLATEILIVSINLFKNNWWFISLLLMALASILLVIMKNPSSKKMFDAFLLRMPLLGKLNRTLQLARFTRTFGSLLNGGVLIISAIQITKGTSNNSAFSNEIDNIQESVTQGQTLAKAIRNQQYFNEVTANMVAVGEETGNLPEMLLDLADIYDQESESLINGLTTLLGPMMIVALGAIIGFVVIAILMPIFETSTIIG